MSHDKKKKRETHNGNGFPFINEQGKPLKQCYENLEFLLQRWDYVIELNVITNRILVGKKGKKIYCNNLDSLAVKIRSSAAKCGLYLGLKDVHSYIQTISEKHCFNPFENYLKKCTADFEKNDNNVIHEMFQCFVLNNEIYQEAKFLEKLVTKWLVGIVRLACNDDSRESGQGVLIIQGPQGIGKTRFARWLMSADQTMVRTGEFIDNFSKDSIMKCLSCVLCELGEFGRSMTDKNKLKAFFTQNEDVFRPPYGMTAKTMPRRTSFVGTVNELGFLIDETGERRYWVLAVNSINFNKLNTININALWAQVKKLADTGYEYWLSQDDIKKINEIAQQFKKMSAEEQKIMDTFDWEAEKNKWSEHTATEIADILGISASRVANVGKILTAMVLSGKIPRCQTHNQYGGKKFYMLPPIDNSNFF